LRISVSTKGGEPVVAAIAQHKPALISTVLSVLGELSEVDVADRVAKDKLRSRLKKAINDALAAKGAPGRIDEVFFTSLVVQ
jgi:flagellar basal body-associated protein FliL